MNIIRQSISWISRIFENEDGTPSSKRAFLIFLSILLFMQVNSNINNVDYFYGILTLTGLCLGAITVENIIKVIEIVKRGKIDSEAPQENP